MSTGLAKTWKAIKALPGWAVAVLMFLVALCWWLVKLVMRNKRKAELEAWRGKLETVRAQELAAVDKEEHEAVDKINKKYNESLARLEREQGELDAAVEAGPAEVAMKWKEYLERNKDE